MNSKVLKCNQMALAQQLAFVTLSDFSFGNLELEPCMLSMRTALFCAAGHEVTKYFVTFHPFVTLCEKCGRFENHEQLRLCYRFLLL